MDGSLKNLTAAAYIHERTKKKKKKRKKCQHRWQHEILKILWMPPHSAVEVVFVTNALSLVTTDLIRWIRANQQHLYRSTLCMGVATAFYASNLNNYLKTFLFSGFL